jgi:hypothetical protein
MSLARHLQRTHYWFDDVLIHLDAGIELAKLVAEMFANSCGMPEDAAYHRQFHEGRSGIGFRENSSNYDSCKP